MPQTIDWPPPARRNRKLLLLVGALALLLFGSGRFLAYYVDGLWFASLGYRAVFWKMLGLQWGLFAGFALLTFLLVYEPFWLCGARTPACYRRAMPLSLTESR